MRASLAGWAAWAPGLETHAAWERWASAPAPLQSLGVPDARFLPPMLRRRCTPLSKIMLKVAFECTPESERAAVRTVFASRHGSINESVELLEKVASREKLSPARFSHTVHNAQAGLFSIATGNRQASSSLSAQEDSFACAVLEALGHLQREPGRSVLLVMGDVPLSETFSSLVVEPASAYAVALLLGSDATADGLEIAIGPAPAVRAQPVWPDAAEFLRFWLAGESSLALCGARQRMDFSRA